jgi:hypothetical protein
MTKREFKDRIGMTWQVWEESGAESDRRKKAKKPGLVFQSRGTRKRLHPVPQNWHGLPEDQLKALWREADFDDADANDDDDDE